MLELIFITPIQTFKRINNTGKTIYLSIHCSQTERCQDRFTPLPTTTTHAKAKCLYTKMSICAVLLKQKLMLHISDSRIVRVICSPTMTTLSITSLWTIVARVFRTANCAMYQLFHSQGIQMRYQFLHPMAHFSLRLTITSKIFSFVVFLQWSDEVKVATQSFQAA
jgi:hypothetical protein